VKRNLPLDDELKQFYEEKFESANGIVREGLYQMGDGTDNITPIYWKDKDLRILRGSWFDDYKTMIADTKRVDRIYNIFHPHDPIAYRLEPIFHENYKNIRPLKLYRSTDSKHSYSDISFECHRSYLAKKKKKDKSAATGNPDSPGEVILEKISNVPMDSEEKDDDDEEEDSDDISSVRSASTGYRCGSPVNLQSARTDSMSTAKQLSIAEIAKEVLPSPEAEMDKLKTIGEAGTLVEEIPLDMRLPYRFDFQTQPDMFDRGMIGVYRSHFSYWTNVDLSAFILNALYVIDAKESTGKTEEKH